MGEVRVYRNTGSQGYPAFRSYKESLLNILQSNVNAVKEGAAKAYDALEKAGKDSPYDLGVDNILLDSMWCFPNSPSKKELLPRKINLIVPLADGKIIRGKEIERKEYWMEIPVDAKTCIVGPGESTRRFIGKGIITAIDTFWEESMTLEKFLEEYRPTTQGSIASWRKKNGVIYFNPEVLVPKKAMKGGIRVMNLL